MAADSSQRKIVAADGYLISSRFFAPAGEAKGAVLVVAAMGVAQTYYAAFAAWLATQGFLVATFDYRGTGSSRYGSLRGFTADIFDWAKLDCAAVIDALQAEAAGKRIYWIGHSLGGQILPLVPNGHRVAKMITVATGNGYWRENSPPLRRVVWMLWYVIAPLALWLFDYFPGKRLHMVGDLPRGVMAQWRRWGLNRNYLIGVEAAAVRSLYASVRLPIVSLSFTDDEFMSASNVKSIHGFFCGAALTLKRIAPRDIGMHRIGHFGFFRSACQASLWAPHLLPELA